MRGYSTFYSLDPSPYETKQLSGEISEDTNQVNEIRQAYTNSLFTITSAPWLPLAAVGSRQRPSVCLHQTLYRYFPF